MPSWDPAHYLRFAGERLRPALDLLGRIPAAAPRIVWDLGCGTGGPTALLRDRWPAAGIHGLDSSPQMLAEAATIDGVDWVLGDIDAWHPDDPVDVIYSNATLHWLDDHGALLPRLLGHLAPGGVLAIQMPRNHGEASHQLLYETARSAQWSERVSHLVRETPVRPPGEYHEMLRPLTATLEVWETIYQQALRGEDPVADFVKGSAVRPFLDALGSDGDRFFSQYAERIRSAYPVGSDGVTLFPFRRVFIVATI